MDHPAPPLAHACQHAPLRKGTTTGHARDGADAILFVLGTDCQWQALDYTELCAHSTAHDRFQEKVEAGVERFDELCGIDWKRRVMDGAMTKALVGGKNPGPIPLIMAGAASNTALTEGHGVPIGMAIEGAPRHDRKLVRATIQSIIVERPKPTEEHPQRMCLDKGL